MAISREQVEKIRVMLQEIPQAPAASIDTTKQTAVRLLVAEIKAVQERGYSLEQVAEFLRGAGLDLTTPTLKSYLTRAKGGRKPRRAGQKTKAVGGAAAPLAAGGASGAVPSEAQKGEKKEEKTLPAARPEPRPAIASGDGIKREENPSGAPDASKLRSGKDAFLKQDKDHY